MTFALKCMAGGLVAVVVAWISILAVEMVHLHRLARQYSPGPNTLYAVAGGWQYLLTSPLRAIILGAAFGLGVFLTARILARA